MMGNLAEGLKAFAVTMFEVGKIAEEQMDAFLSELDKVLSRPSFAPSSPVIHLSFNLYSF